MPQRNHGTDFLDDPAPRSRPVKGSNDGSLDIQSAVDFLDQANEQVFHLSKELALFSAHAKAMIEGPLTLDCVIALLQDSLPRKSGGDGRQSKDMIRMVLEGAANLGGKYLKPMPAKR